MADADDGSSRKSAFWWVDAVRYVVAGVVVVLIAAVVINAIKVVFRPESLDLLVVGGSISVRNISSSADPDSSSAMDNSDDTSSYKSVALSLNLRGVNPSGRARMYYTGIVMYLLDNTTSPFSPSLDNDSLISTSVDDKAVAQQGLQDSVVEATVENATGYIDPANFNILYTGGTFSNVTMRLDGNLSTEVRVNRTRLTTYLCGPLLIGAGSDDVIASMNLKDVPCKELQNGNYIQ